MRKTLATSLAQITCEAGRNGLLFLLSAPTAQASSRRVSALARCGSARVSSQHSSDAPAALLLLFSFRVCVAPWSTALYHALQGHQHCSHTAFVASLRGTALASMFEILYLKHLNFGGARSTFNEVVCNRCFFGALMTPDGRGQPSLEALAADGPEIQRPVRIAFHGVLSLYSSYLLAAKTQLQYLTLGT